MASNTPTRPTQGNTPILSLQDANQLDGTVFDIADHLKNVVMLVEDMGNYYPAIPELREILRNVKSAHAALEKAKSPTRRLWNIANYKASGEGRRHG